MPKTSKTASEGEYEQEVLIEERRYSSPGVEAELGAFSVSPDESDDGAACIWIYRRLLAVPMYTGAAA